MLYESGISWHRLFTTHISPERSPLGHTAEIALWIAKGHHAIHHDLLEVTAFCASPPRAWEGRSIRSLVIDYRMNRKWMIIPSGRVYYFGGHPYSIITSICICWTPIYNHAPSPIRFISVPLFVLLSESKRIGNFHIHVFSTGAHTQIGFARDKFPLQFSSADIFPVRNGIFIFEVNISKESKIPFRVGGFIFFSRRSAIYDIGLCHIWQTPLKRTSMVAGTFSHLKMAIGHWVSYHS